MIEGFRLLFNPDIDVLTINNNILYRNNKSKYNHTSDIKRKIYTFEQYKLRNRQNKYIIEFIIYVNKIIYAI